MDTCSVLDRMGSQALPATKAAHSSSGSGAATHTLNIPAVGGTSRKALGAVEEDDLWEEAQYDTLQVDAFLEEERA